MINQRHRRTDGRTDDMHCSASRGKNLHTYKLPHKSGRAHIASMERQPIMGFGAQPRASRVQGQNHRAPGHGVRERSPLKLKALVSQKRKRDASLPIFAIM